MHLRSFLSRNSWTPRDTWNSILNPKSLSTGSHIECPETSVVLNRALHKILFPRACCCGLFLPIYVCHRIRPSWILVLDLVIVYVVFHSNVRIRLDFVVSGNKGWKVPSSMSERISFSYYLKYVLVLSSQVQLQQSEHCTDSQDTIQKDQW